jgi:GNAT superfamily N-acetyltransferase
VTAGIRDWRDEDAEAIAGLLREVAPYWLVTPAMLRFEAHVLPPRARRRLWVAEADGELVAYADANMRWTSVERDRGEIWVAVAPAARRRGLGGDLYERAEEHLGAAVIDAEAADDDGVRFAEALGFRVTGRERYFELDPQMAEPGEEEPPPGVSIVPLGALLDRPRELHAVYAEAELDMPSSFERERLDYDEWVAETLGNPLLDPELSRVVLEDGRAVSFALVTADREGGRAEHELTGTVRDQRGRGLARLAKLAALRWCADNGVHTVLTANDLENAPMLRINERLGYRPTIESVEIAKTL